MDAAAAERLLETKYRGWSYEREFRFGTALNKPDSNGMYFRKFDETLRLREVILGPLCSIAEAEVRERLSGYDQPVRVTRTRLAFKTFSVVEDRRYRVST